MKTVDDKKQNVHVRIQNLINISSAVISYIYNFVAVWEKIFYGHYERW